MFFLMVNFFLLFHCSAALIVKWFRNASQNYGLLTNAVSIRYFVTHIAYHPSPPDHQEGTSSTRHMDSEVLRKQH